MPDAIKNFSYSTVATAPSPATTGTSLVLASGEGANFPTSAEAPYNIVIWPTASQPTNANAEIVTVTDRSTDTLTIVRQAESTSARTVIIGDQVALTITSKLLNDIAGKRVPTENITVSTGSALEIKSDFEIASGKLLDLRDDSLIEID